MKILRKSLGYLMRTGAPDSLDRRVATSYANLAIDHVFHNQFGSMVSVQSGVYTTVPLDCITRKAERLDVEEFYDSGSYLPKVARQMGKPMFLY